jgi:Ca-activated chloride channel family protein
MRFADPLALLLLLLVGAYLWVRWPRRARMPRVWLPLPTFALLPEPAQWERGRERWVWLPVALRAAVLTLLILALARPRTPGVVRNENLRGRNIVFALDISSSMKAEDFAPSRLGAARQVLADFVHARQGDFMGLVLFASRPFTQVPLTDDESVMLQMLRNADIGLLPDGTAIGPALAMAENLLKDLPRNSGLIILVTDGGNNTGTPDPLTAAALARAIGVRVYAVGMAAGGAHAALPDEWVRGRGRLYEPSAPSLSSEDEDLLRAIAKESGGEYYRASDANALQAIVSNIDALETSRSQVRDILSWHEYYLPLTVAALVLFAFELSLRSLWLRTVPGT